MSRAGAKTRSEKKVAKAQGLPGFIPPCLASSAPAPPQGDDWIHEIKFDGYRLQAHIGKGDVRLLTRTGLDWTARFAHLAKSLAALKVTSAIIDGEAVVEDDRGASDFVALVEALKAGRSTGMAYYAFDLMFLNGKDTRPLPLRQRKAQLQALLAPLPARGAIRLSQHIEREGRAMFAQVCKLGLEGIISKHAGKAYRSGRRDDWLKIKCLQSDEFVIGGFIGSTTMKDAVGALALGYYDGKALRYAGRVGTGFTQRTARDLFQLLSALRRDHSPFDAPLTPAQRRGVVYVNPRLVAQIEYRAWSSDNLLRHAAYKSLREDKPARTVIRPAAVKA